MRAARTGLALLLAAAWPAAASASGTLEFDAGGYAVAMEIGDDARPTVARVRFFPPGDSTGIALPPQEVRVDAFDPRHQRLHLEHRGKASGAPAFELRVVGGRGVLEIDGQTLKGPFDWQL